MAWIQLELCVSDLPIGQSMYVAYLCDIQNHDLS